MVKLGKIIKWYLKTIMTTPVYEVVLFLIALVQIGSMYLFNGYFLLIFVSSILSFPIMAILSGTGVYRDKSAQLLELNLFKDRRKIALAKFVSVTLSFLPVFAFNSAFLSIHHYSFLIIPSILSMLVLISLISVSALYRSSSKAVISTMMYAFLIPMAIDALLNNYMMLQTHPSIVFSAISYIFSPIFSIYYFKVGLIELMPWEGYIFSLIFSLIVITISIFLSEELEIKP